MYCPKCGKKISDNAKFCRYCGARLTPGNSQGERPEADGKASSAPVRQAAQPRQAVPPAQPSNPPRKSGGGRVALLIAGMVIVAALVIAAGAFMLGQHRAAEEDAVTKEAVTETLSTAEISREETTKAVSSTEESSAAESSAEETEEMTDPETSAVPPVPSVSDVPVSHVTATSQFHQEPYHYDPANVCDGDLATAWVEGVDGYGEGQSITIHYGETCRISGISIWNGYQKNSDIYTKNSRPADITVSLDDGQSWQLTLKDQMGRQDFQLDEPLESANVTITINAAYGGTKYTDTAISEISLN